jgi:hypothetical protein
MSEDQEDNNHIDKDSREKIGEILMTNVLQFPGKANEPPEEKLVTLTLDEAFRGAIVAWIQLHDTQLADILYGYVDEGYTNGRYVIEIPEKYWIPVQEEIYGTVNRIKEEAKAQLQKSDD